MTVTRTLELADLTPAELAELFCGMFADEQAEFFAHITLIARGWPGAGWCQQSCSITEKLSQNGIDAIRTLALHALPELAEDGETAL